MASLIDFRVSGWGTLAFHGGPSDQLRAVDVPIVSDEGAFTYPLYFVLCSFLTLFWMNIKMDFKCRGPAVFLMVLTLTRW